MARRRRHAVSCWPAQELLGSRRAARERRRWNLDAGDGGGGGSGEVTPESAASAHVSPHPAAAASASTAAWSHTRHEAPPSHDALPPKWRRELELECTFMPSEGRTRRRADDAAAAAPAAAAARPGKSGARPPPQAEVPQAKARVVAQRQRRAREAAATAEAEAAEADDEAEAGPSSWQPPPSKPKPKPAAPTAPAAPGFRCGTFGCILADRHPGRHRFEPTALSEARASRARATSRPPSPPAEAATAPAPAVAAAEAAAAADPGDDSSDPEVELDDDSSSGSSSRRAAGSFTLRGRTYVVGDCVHVKPGKDAADADGPCWVARIETIERARAGDVWDAGTPLFRASWFFRPKDTHLRPHSGGGAGDGVTSATALELFASTDSDLNPIATICGACDVVHVAADDDRTVQRLQREGEADGGGGGRAGKRRQGAATSCNGDPRTRAFTVAPPVSLVPATARWRARRLSRAGARRRTTHSSGGWRWAGGGTTRAMFVSSSG